MRWWCDLIICSFWGFERFKKRQAFKNVVRFKTILLSWNHLNVDQNVWETLNCKQRLDVGNNETLVGWVCNCIHLGADSAADSKLSFLNAFNVESLYPFNIYSLPYLMLLWRLCSHVNLINLTGTYASRHILYHLMHHPTNESCSNPLSVRFDANGAMVQQNKQRQFELPSCSPCKKGGKEEARSAH